MATNVVKFRWPGEQQRRESRAALRSAAVKSYSDALHDLESFAAKGALKVKEFEEKVEQYEYDTQTKYEYISKWDDDDCDYDDEYDPRYAQYDIEEEPG